METERSISHVEEKLSFTSSLNTAIWNFVCMLFNLKQKLAVKNLEKALGIMVEKQKKQKKQ